MFDWLGLSLAGGRVFGWILLAIGVCLIGLFVYYLMRNIKAVEPVRKPVPEFNKSGNSKYSINIVLKDKDKAKTKKQKSTKK